AHEEFEARGLGLAPIQISLHHVELVEIGQQCACRRVHAATFTHDACRARSTRAAHRDRLDSERRSYFNLRNGALGRVWAGCLRAGRPSAWSQTPLQWRGAGLPVAARQAKSSEPRDKEQWPTKSFPSLHALRCAGAAISRRTARSCGRSRALPPTSTSSSPFIAAWC